MPARLAALWLWCFGTWAVLTWTLTAEQMLVGAVLAAAVSAALAPFGPVGRPWRVLTPDRLGALAALAGTCLVRTVRANVGLVRRVWTPSLPLRSGMVVVPTGATTEGGVAAVGLLTSVIVDNQLVDLDRSSSSLQYHAVEVTSTDPETERRRINGPVERWVLALAGREPA